MNDKLLEVARIGDTSIMLTGYRATRRDGDD